MRRSIIPGETTIEYQIVRSYHSISMLLYVDLHARVISHIFDTPNRKSVCPQTEAHVEIPEQP